MVEKPQFETEPRPTTPEEEPEEIVLQAGNSEVSIIRMGALVSSFKVADTEVLMPDQKYTDNGKRRGGNPLLFPNAGPLTEEDTGNLDLPQHGFARSKEWSLVEQTEHRAVLRLASDDETLSQYPYDFEAEMEVSLEEGRLTQTVRVTNNLEKEMPIAPGFHPYISVPTEDKPTIDTNIPGFVPQDYDWETPMVHDMQYPVEIDTPTGSTIINSSENLKTLLIWSERDRPHVCVEPWRGDVDAILDEDSRINVAPNESTNFSISISYQERAI